jgi:hypothetical protein
LSSPRRPTSRPPVGGASSASVKCHSTGPAPRPQQALPAPRRLLPGGAPQVSCRTPATSNSGSDLIPAIVGSRPAANRGSPHPGPVLQAGVPVRPVLAAPCHPRLPWPGCRSRPRNCPKPGTQVRHVVSRAEPDPAGQLLGGPPARPRV